MKKRLKLWGWLIGLTIVLALLAAGVKTWTESRYEPQNAALAALASDDAVEVRRMEEGIAFVPDAPGAGFIFYPGGLVPAEAYAPLLRALAQEGILCVALDMPLRLAVLDMNAAAGIGAQFPEIARWSIGGHSLGGAMAAAHAANHAEAYQGLVLLAAYSTAEIPAHMNVVSVYGDADGVMNRDKYAQYRANLPAHASETVISGGNHAQFGDYGLQAGDGLAAIPPQEQLAAAVQAILPVLTGKME